MTYPVECAVEMELGIGYVAESGPVCGTYVFGMGVVLCQVHDMDILSRQILQSLREQRSGGNVRARNGVAEERDLVGGL